MTTPQQEHAARQRERARRIFRDELAALGIAADKHVERAVVRLASGFVLTIEPRHFGSSVNITPFLPRDLAREVNDTPCDCFGGGYSDDNGRLGGYARADGHAGGLPSERITSSVRGWDCDSIGALGVLLRTVADVIARRGLTADDARLLRMREYTDEFLSDAYAMQSLDGATRLGDLIRRELHTGVDIDPSDPRVIALRAKYPRAQDVAP